MQEYNAAESVVQLELLGRFRLLVAGQDLSDAVARSSKLKSILCYLILHRHRSVSRDELIEIFYEDENQSDPVSALRMQIMRIRQLLTPLLGEDSKPILGRRGDYQWNGQFDCRVDAEQFEALCLQAESIQGDSPEKSQLFHRALKLYTGEMVLSSEGLQWAMVLGTRYHSRFITAAENSAILQLSQGHFASVEELCLNAIRHAPTNELLYTCLIQALLQQKRFAEARHCYEQINEALHQQLGVSPSPKLQQLYQNICQGKMSQESDLGQVIGSLREKAGQKPAFYCDFDQFRSIYQLEARRAPRTGSCLQVVMLNVGETGRSDTGMSQVLHALVHSLRSSDVVARYSDSQFIIMLPDANLEDSQRVMERVSRAYSKTYPTNAAKLQWQIRALEIL